MAAQSNEHLHGLINDLKPLYHRLENHPLYHSFKTLRDLQVFMESHVFAVWDFMSLLKTLQINLTCTNIPWMPSGFHKSARFINEIVVGEESDETDDKSIASHFELYLQAMRECGASVLAIENMLTALGNGAGWNKALLICNAPKAAQHFVHTTFNIIETKSLPAIAAAFTFGREDIIPTMFREFIVQQDTQLQGKLKMLRWYLERHVTIDGDEHGPMALAMMMEICGQNEQKWQEAKEAALMALGARINLWDQITQQIHAMQANENLAVIA